MGWRLYDENQIGFFFNNEEFMINYSDERFQPYIKKVFSFNQEHVFKFWDDLSDSSKQNLLNQIENIDFELLERLYKSNLEKSSQNVPEHKLDVADIYSLEQRKEYDQKYYEIGEDILAKGKVAAFLVAGGQGTRLGYDGPKGAYPVTPVKKKSLFQLHAEKLHATGKKYGKIIPWFIMTSETNHQQTIDFFNQNNFFGLQKDTVFFFKQEMIPALDKNGKLILDAKDHIFTNPNGHGGSLSALWKSGSIAKMKSMGIEYIFYFQVDNSLIKMCDPTFIGYHIAEKSEMSCKVLRKKYPEEKMGVICKINGKTGLTEYSDLSETDMYATNPDGSLKFWAGSIAIHVLNVSFVEKENKDGFKLPYHIANKAISYLDNSGKLIEPDEKNGIKFETFVFDALLDTEKSISIEVERSDEFSPLKNSEGENSPVTVKQDLNNMYGRWLEKAGMKIPKDADNNSKYNIEISPLFALTESDLKNKQLQMKEIKSDLYLE